MKHTIAYITTIVGVLVPVTAWFVAIRLGFSSVGGLQTGMDAHIQFVAQAIGSAIH